uniref:Ras-GEF domain-containing protein n=1 Tax=Panagrolaimus sp. ES5 TaxID=591445 RepID=A0AC34FPW2_9BILA
MEIEATYAPFINKQAQLSARYDRSLSQKTIINQAKKRLNGSEHDLIHLLAASSPSSTNSTLSNQLSSSKSFGHLNNRSSENDATKISYSNNSYKNNGIKVTSFGVDENNGFCTEKTFVPPKSSRPLPKFPPPKSPIAFPEDLDDYDDVDYEAMEDEQNRINSNQQQSTIPLIRSPPAIPPKPLSLLKQKRNSEFIDSSKVEQKQYIDPNRKHSAHSLFQSTSNDNGNRNSEDLESPEDSEAASTLPAYLDRTQSCQNLVYRQRTKSGKDLYDMDEETFRRYPSVKIDPPPLLPTRSKESLCSISALASSAAVAATISPERKLENHISNADAMDYDDIKNGGHEEPDYDKVKAKELSLLITSEDIKVFNLTQTCKNNNKNESGPINALKKLFMSESRVLREEVLDRNACLQLTVSMTIQKAHNSKDILKVWILTASHLLHKIGNGFSFGALMAAIISEKAKHPRAFMELDASTMAHLKSLIPIYEDFIGGKMPPLIAGCFLPFIQPLLQLFSTSSDYVQANKLKNINSNGLDNLEILSNMILLARHIIFENNGKLEDSIEASKMSGPNPFSTESLIHCLLATPSLSTEPKESERRKIRQMFEQNN